MNNDIISVARSNHPQKITVFVECLFTQLEKKEMQELKNISLEFHSISSVRIHMIVRFIVQ